MELLACMSIAGSVPVVICLFIYIIQRKNYNYVLGKRLLLTGLFFYLVPVQLIKYLIPEKAYPEVLFNEEAQLYLSNSLSFWHERKGEYIWMPQWFNVVATIWMAGIIVFSLYELIKYCKETRSIKNYIFETVNDTENNITYYLIPDGICGPCTIGFFHQKIAIPESFPLHPNFIMVYKHEYAHLRNHDNFVKLLCLLVLCLHWMNPVAYLLFYLYRDTAEIVSDGAAVEGCDKETRRAYATLLVLLASTPDILPAVWKNNLSGHKKKSGRAMNIIKRRINYMMKEKRKGLLQRGIMVAVSALTIVAGAGTVLAYEAMPSSDVSVTESIDNNSDFGKFNDMVILTDFSKGDSIFIDFNGNEFVVDDYSNHALCTHSMVDGYWQVHSSNNSGGCSVKVYKAQRCKKCGYLANAVYQYTATYDKCPH
jgi:beta-lactamase regulating signal transducer with metallopeptidase domain